MTRFVRAPLGLSCLACFFSMALPAFAAPPTPPTRFQAEVQVENPTRLDWEFAAASFGPEAVKLPGDYDSRKQRYQLYVPGNYDRARSWPLVVFLSPGDDPLGWRAWQQPCEEAGLLFCAAYGAGNNCPPGERTRIVLDMLDDVRRHYHINPDETYLTGFSGGGRMACSIAFALPEYFGGVAPICGTNPLHRVAYLGHRVQDRLSVAFVTGANDINRGENEDYMAPLFQELGIRSKLWVVPALGHALPSPAVLKEVLEWLAADLKRRQADVKARPGLATPPEEVLTPLRQATGLLETAEAELKQPERTWRSAALLQGIVTRWGKTEAGEKARKLLDEIQGDPKRVELLAEQGGTEERRTLLAQARGFEKLGDYRRALQAYQLLVGNHADTPDGKKAAGELKRLATLPFLGVAFAADGVRVAQVLPRSPADLAGVKPGDVVVKLGESKITSLQELRRVLQEHKAGDKVTLEVQRGDKAVTLDLELGTLPVERQ
jgi:hypothetical protein